MTTHSRLRTGTCALIALIACSLPVRAQEVAGGSQSTAVESQETAPDSDPAQREPVSEIPALASPRLIPNVAETPLHQSVWHDLFTGTWDDARRLPSRGTLQWVGIGAVAALGTRPADSHVGRSLSKISELEEPLEPGAFIGSTPLQLAMSAATYGIGRATDSPRMVAVGADLFRAQIISQGLTIGMKESVRRHRPEGGGFAFPSGHTTVSFSSATVLQQHFGWRAGAPAYALASYVALSRVQMKRHYLSDVAFGAALGIAVGRTITLGREHRMMLAPMAADGGGGVQLTWLGRR